MDRSNTLTRCLAVAVLSIAALSAGCRDLTPRISTNGHILAGRPSPTVSASDLAAGRLVARSEYLTGLETELARVQRLRLSLFRNADTQVRGSSALTFLPGLSAETLDNPFVPVVAGPAGIVPLPALSIGEFRTGYRTICESDSVFAAAIPPGATGSCDPIPTSSFDFLVDDFAFDLRLSEAEAQWSAPTLDPASCTFSTTPASCRRVCRGGVRRGSFCTTNAQCGARGSFCDGVLDCPSPISCTTAADCPASMTCASVRVGPGLSPRTSDQRQLDLPVSDN